MAKNDGGPAFPMPPDYYASASGIFRQVVPGEQGASLRDYFAAAAIHLIERAMADGYWTPGPNPAREIAEGAYEIADAMLAERDK